jgi:uncharacterized protein YdeI (YjbR/CyaY-like superfamily)
MATPKSHGSFLPAVDLYIAKSADFAQPILHHLREILHEGAPDLVEEIKWSRPFFVYRGIILGNISAFKHHCSLGLWGSEVAEVLRADGVASKEAMGSFGRITSLEDLPPRKKLLGYVKSAAKMIDEGVRTKSLVRQPKVAKPAVELPEVFAVALKKNKVATKHFDAMSPSCRREYVDWIVDAKRDETRDKRIATALEWIAIGKSRNWKYETPAKQA